MKWLSIETTLPLGRYNILITNGDWVEAVNEHGLDGGEYYFHNGTGKVDGVTHWMPFPKPPRRKDEAIKSLNSIVEMLVEAELKGKSPLECLLFIMKENKKFKESHENN